MKKLIKFLIVVIVIIIAIGLGFNYMLNTGKAVAVDWSDKDFSNAISKTQIAIDDIKSVSLENLIENRFSTDGKVVIEEYFSNEEMSALTSSANHEGKLINEVNLKFGQNNNGEMSFKISEKFVDFLKDSGILENIVRKKIENNSIISNLAVAESPRDLTTHVINYITSIANNMPVYARGHLSRTSDNTISIDISELKVGRVAMPERVVVIVEREVVKFVNSLITSQNGFTIEELRIEDGKLYYKGTLPAEIKGIAR
ncbi:MAG: hypothetical protein ACLKAK_00935 [Alkaliphilus sp.]